MFPIVPNTQIIIQDAISNFLNPALSMAHCELAIWYFTGIIWLFSCYLKKIQYIENHLYVFRSVLNLQGWACKISVLISSMFVYVSMILELRCKFVLVLRFDSSLMDQHVCQMWNEFSELMHSINFDSSFRNRFEYKTLINHSRLLIVSIVKSYKAFGFCQWTTVLHKVPRNDCHEDFLFCVKFNPRITSLTVFQRGNA